MDAIYGAFRTLSLGVREGNKMEASDFVCPLARQLAGHVCFLPYSCSRPAMIPQSPFETSILVALTEACLTIPLREKR